MSDKNNKDAIRVKKEPQMVRETDELSIYVNIAKIAISPEEVLIQFGLIDPDNPSEANSVARVYMSPGHAKRLLVALESTIRQHESLFGPIVENVEDKLTTEGRKRFGMNDHE